MPGTSSAPDVTAVTSSGRRLAFLDVLRGIAAVSVCLHHVLERSAFYRSLSLRWFNPGTFGVVVFFLVSGFIIPASLEKHASVPQFWKGRALRLYPMYIVVLVLALAYNASIHVPVCPGTPHPALCVAANLTFLQEFFHSFTIVSVAWTLSLEIVFYALCSAAFAWNWRRAQAWLAFGSSIALLVAAIASAALHRSIPIGRLGLLAFSCYGVLLYAVHQNRAPKARLLPPAIFLTFGLFVGFATRSALHRVDRYGEGFTLVSLCTTWAGAATCFTVLYALREAQLPNTLQWLGRISYSFYLLAWLMPPLRMTVLPGAGWAWLDVALPIALSAFTYSYIERPFMRIGSPRPESLSPTLATP